MGGDDEDNNANQLADQEILRNRADIEAKRESLVKQRIAIIKDQGLQQWSPDRQAAMQLSPDQVQRSNARPPSGAFGNMIGRITPK